MTRYTAPLRDYRFALFDVLGLEAQSARLGNEADRETVEAVLEEAARFAGQVLAPLNQAGDEHGCSFDAATGEVRTPPGFREAYARFVEDGWQGLTVPAEIGGQGLPLMVDAVFKEMLDAANLSWSTYPLLSHGAIEALRHQGEDWQKQAFLTPIVEGRWTGTMCLTEPHCGTDLGLLKTRAEPQADGSYAITGTKIFISAGEHDFTENIVHLVLARLPDAPPGVKGISLFLVPKFQVGRDGAMGARNAVRCGAIEHKMGLKGSATCVINFDGAQGWLVGQPHRGLQGMFIMMNSARLGVGVQGLGLMERATQNALAYARERLQMRALGGPKLPEKPADPIIVHPDVRRMLLTNKALTEGARLLAAYAFAQLDEHERGTDADGRARGEALAGFLTPIVKGCLTEWAVECTYNAIQVYGGHGYIREHGIEQFARDARITTLYEGTTQIQANDLVGRKLLQLKGAGLRLFLAEIERFCADHASDATLAEFVAPLGEAAADWATLTQEVVTRAGTDPEEIGAAAVDYLFCSGYVALGYWWARAVAALRGGDQPEAFRSAKLETARFYYGRILPRRLAHAAAIRSGAGTLMRLDAAAFDA
ncbi:acyl-CoA dehydrogenase C-terminal domain-containing protein [Coralloluteibacterium stylophorae]|uniref:3-methylmercaptopropionyl-CoA dehydrogenase n=3 Tax=Coralloluteibacterium stylophorae TaxID=1776034 RepID=A0AAP2CAS4_9GAMM|nr:acyl-CoA dehydrogenase C-terminal domain-containing protein [Coralloluteibacterium stylophorae]MBS7456142.1 acyl-CoA dehydrogenase C-terminal domain-containing protein [Coralloluteibacterium stylophorae]